MSYYVFYKTASKVRKVVKDRSSVRTVGSTCGGRGALGDISIELREKVRLKMGERERGT